MLFQKPVEINTFVIAGTTPKLQTGQHITMDGNPGRWVGRSKGGTYLIVWPNTAGRNNVPAAIRAYKGLKA